MFFTESIMPSKKLNDISWKVMKWMKLRLMLRLMLARSEIVVQLNIKITFALSMILVNLILN